jgi:isopenicillin N synthase-like dioxygenase
MGHESTLALDSAPPTGSKKPGNQWPPSLGQDFKDEVLSYFAAVEELALKMYPLLALALGLPENWFSDKVTTSGSRMRLLWYPPQTGVVDDRSMGIGACDRCPGAVLIIGRGTH